MGVMTLQQWPQPLRYTSTRVDIYPTVIYDAWAAELGVPERSIDAPFPINHPLPILLAASPWPGRSVTTAFLSTYGGALGLYREVPADTSHAEYMIPHLSHIGFASRPTLLMTWQLQDPDGDLYQDHHAIATGILTQRAGATTIIYYKQWAAKFDGAMQIGYDCAIRLSPGAIVFVGGPFDAASDGSATIYLTELAEPATSDTVLTQVAIQAQALDEIHRIEIIIADDLPNPTPAPAPTGPDYRARLLAHLH